MAEEVKVTNSYVYKLSLGANIEDKSKGSETLDIPQNSKSITIDEKRCTICLNGVKYTRKIYEPGLIEAEVTLLGPPKSDLPSMSSVIELFLKRIAQLTITHVQSTTQTSGTKNTQNGSGNQKSNSTSTDEVIAKHYFVYQVNPVLVKNVSASAYTIKLTIYSLDKLMTLDKFSKSYVAKRLALDILKKGYTRFGLKDDQVNVDCNNLKHLKYKNSKNEDAEMIQPYLVQYNETFYDFMVRTANRCGEFFYFEDGKLTIGLPASTSVKAIKTYDSVTMQEFSNNPLDINIYTRDGVKDNETISGFNADPIEKDDAKFPADAFPAKPSYNAELTHDDLIFPMKKDNFTSYTNDLGFNTKDLAVSAAKKIATNEGGYTGIPEMIRSFASDMAATAIGAFKSNSETNNDGNKDFVDIVKNAPAQFDGTTAVQFGTVVKSGWPTLEFYTKVRRQEEAQQKKMVCIDLGANYTSLKLGDKIKIDGLTDIFIVTHVTMCSANEWKRNYRKFEDDNQTDLYAGKQSQQVWAIPTYKEKENVTTDIPPIMNIPYIRKSGPQTAFVIDNGDPKKQGRVRIAYPWQSGSETVRQALFTAREEMEASQKKLDDIKKMLEEKTKPVKANALEEAEKDLKAKKEDVDKKADAWSKDLKSVASPWIRVVSPMATDGGGAYFMPQKGDEVFVNYDSDNIERPYVVGSVYSKNLNEPNSGHKGAITLQSPNGQFITLSAAGGKKFLESIAPVLKPMQTYIPAVKDAMKKVDKEIGGGITLSDTYGMFKIDMSSHGRKIDIESPFGKVGISAFTGITINAPNGDIKIKGKNVSIEAGNNLTLKSGTNVNYDDFSLAETIKSMVKDTVNELGEAGLDLVDLSMVKTMKVVDYALIRSVWDTFLKPIEGTLCIKSNNYMKLEAGKGKAEVPLERYSDRWQDYKKAEKENEKQIFYSKVSAYAKLLDQKIKKFSEDYQNAKAIAYEKKEAYDWLVDHLVKPDKVNSLQDVRKEAFKLGDAAFTKYNDTTHAEGLVKMEKFKQENLQEKIWPGYWVSGLTFLRSEADIQNHIRKVVEAYAEAVYNVQRIAQSADTVFSDLTIQAVNKSVLGSKDGTDTQWIDDIFKNEANTVMGDILGAWETRYGSKGTDPKDNFLSGDDKKGESDPLVKTKYYKRVALAKMLVKINNHANNLISVPVPAGAAAVPPVPGKYFSMKCALLPTTVDKSFVDSHWTEIITLGDRKWGILMKTVKFFAEVFDFLEINKQWKPILDPNAPLMGWAQKVWNDKSGQIIFSTKKGATYVLDGDQIEKYEYREENNKESLKKTLLEFAK